MKNSSLESRIKGVITGLTFCLTMALIAMSLCIDFQETCASEKKRVKEMGARVAPLSREELLSLTESKWAINTFGKGVSLRGQEGPVWITLDKKIILGEVLHRRRYLLVAGMICLLFSAEIAVFLAYGLTRPLKRLAWGCAQVEQGNLSNLPGEISASYEIATLQRAFNDMVRGLREWQALERQVSRVDRLAALGQVVAGVSHEIKNPLAAMRIHLDLVQDVLEGAEKDSLQVVSSELDRLNRVVTQLLSFARPSSGVLGPVDAQGLFEWCHRIMRVRLSRKELRWEAHAHEGVTFWGDSGQLQQILVNLVLNSVEAMDKGGVLSLEARSREEGTWLSVRLAAASAGPSPGEAKTGFPRLVTVLSWRVS